jgi:hypothetical protein
MATNAQIIQEATALETVIHDLIGDGTTGYTELQLSVLYRAEVEIAMAIAYFNAAINCWDG